MLLTEDLQPISPQEAKDKGLFGPVYHGSTSDKLEKINTQGFKIAVGQERFGDISNGYEMSNYNGGIPSPIHHLGFGVYMTTVKAIAKQFSYGNTQIGPYFLDSPRLETINFGSPRTMMKWWLENGYDYRKTPETTYGNEHTNLEAIRQERMRSTLHLTDYLKSKYDAVWFKGMGLRRLLDGDQVCVYETSKIYKVDKSLIKSGEIGSKVVAKVGIDPYNRGTIEIPMGTKGIIIDKKSVEETIKNYPLSKERFGDSKFEYIVKWEKSGIMYNILDSWIEPYVKKTKMSEEESKIYRRNFWKIYEDVYKLNESSEEYYEINKKEELEAINYIKKLWKNEQISKTLKKVRHDRKTKHGDRYYDQIDYSAFWNGTPVLFQIRKNGWGIVYRTVQEKTGKSITSFHRIISSEKLPDEPSWTDGDSLTESSQLNLSISREEEHRVVDAIKRNWSPYSNNNELGKTLKKFSHEKNSSIGNIKTDIIKYEGYINEILLIFNIEKSKNGIGYWVIDGNGVIRQRFRIIIPYKSSLNEKLEKRYFPMTKKEELESLHTIVMKMRIEGREGTRFHKIASRNKVRTSYISPYENADERDYLYTAFDGSDMVLTIRKQANNISYRIESPERIKKFPTYAKYGSNFYNLYNKSETLQESDSDHGEALRTTGYWGKAGAGAIILSKRTGRILLPYRSGAVEQPHTWGVWGGAIDSNEDPSQAVRRELSEEVGAPLQIDELIPLYVYGDSKVGFRYHNFLAVVSEEFQPRLNWETENSRWISFGDWPSPLHFGLRSLLENSKDKIFEEIKKYIPQEPTNVSTPQDKEKYKSAVYAIKKVWQSMFRIGEKDKFSGYDFKMYAMNEQPLQEMFDEFGKKFFPQAHEPSHEFLDYAETVLEKLEQQYNKRRAAKMNPNDPLFVLKKIVRGKTWEGAKQSLEKISLAAQLYKGGRTKDEQAEALFNRLYRVALGETMYDIENTSKMPRLSDIQANTNNPNDYINTFLRYNAPEGATKFPDKVMVYRGTPSPLSKIRPGDFLTLDKDYARDYMRGKYGTVISDILPSKDLLVQTMEPEKSHLIYWPVGHQIKKVENVPSFRQFYNQWAFI
jgi:8-oxo-dGTP pyrophosphatase MutT (NUDIX family)